MTCPHCNDTHRVEAFYQNDPHPVWVTCSCFTEHDEGMFAENSRLKAENVMLRNAIERFASAGYIRRKPNTPSAPPEPDREPL